MRGDQQEGQASEQKLRRQFFIGKRLEPWQADRVTDGNQMNFLCQIQRVALVGAGLFALVLSTAAQQIVTLPNTAPLTWTNDLSVAMHEAAHRDVERLIAESLTNRAALWNREMTSPKAYQQSVLINREHLRVAIGVVDERVPVTVQSFGDAENPALVAEVASYRIYQVRWPVLEGVTGEGLLLSPKTKAVGCVVALADADQTPEQTAGMVAGVKLELQFARSLAERGFEVVVPVLIDRSDRWSGNTNIAMVNQPHREWIHRQAYHMGRHIIGYEVQKVLALVDWFQEKRPDAKIGVAGHGEGGLIAFYAAALDPRIHSTLVSGYFRSRQRTWEEPIYRNVFGLLREFGDAELASLIAPRSLLIEYSPYPIVEGPLPLLEGRKKSGAPGVLDAPPLAEVVAEFERIETLFPIAYQARKLMRGSDDLPIGPMAPATIREFATSLGFKVASVPANDRPTDRRKGFDTGPRQQRQVKELENHVQWLVRDADVVRNKAFLYEVMPDFEKIPWNNQLKADVVPVEQFAKDTRRFRDEFWSEIIGRWPEGLADLNPRTRRILDQPKWTGYDVVLDVSKEGFAWGVLLVPKNLKPGEKRPVVVCQHGRNGTPLDTITGNKPAYNDFAARLAERGYVVYAPHNLYKTEALYRMLNRKANTLKLSMFSLILAHHEQALDWLETLPFVDPKRIAFYGLSYGGETAVRVPPLLDRYCLSICSGDFNDWARKVASTRDRHSFMFTDEWEMPYFNMGSTFNYAELAYLMIPRPFMVERGHRDGVAPDQWVASEYAKVRWLYDQFGLGDKTAIEFFNGGHTINGVGTFQFLDKHLNWKP